MPVRQILKFPIRFLRTSLRKDQSVYVVEIFLRNAFVGQVHIFSQYVRRHVEILVLAVEQQDIREGFRRERRVLQKPGQFFETVLRVVFHVHQSLVHQGHRVQFVLTARRHVDQGLFCRRVVFY